MKLQIFLFRGLMPKCPSSGNRCQSDFYPVLLARWSNFTSIFFTFQMGWFNHNHQRTHNFGGRKSMPLKIFSPKAGPKPFVVFSNNPPTVFFGWLKKYHFGKTPNKTFIRLFWPWTCRLLFVGIFKDATIGKFQSRKLHPRILSHWY